MRVPTDREILALHEKHAPNAGALDVVYTHCLIVCGIAEQLHARSGADLDLALVRAGSLLHDIGVYRLYDDVGQFGHADYIRHGLLGHQLLREEGFPEEICRFASRHTGMGLTRDDVRRQGLPLPPDDYVAETGEEVLVMYADKFHSKTMPPAFLTADAYAASVRRFGEDKVATFKTMREAFGEPDLAPFVSAYGQELRDLRRAPPARTAHVRKPGRPTRTHRSQPVHAYKHSTGWVAGRGSRSRSEC